MPETMKAEYSIAAVSKLTGVSCHALRVWERRYGFPVPNRSASGHRRYSAGQVAVLCRLAELAHSGRSIGELIVEFREGRLEAPAAPGPAEKSPPARVVDRLLAADSVGADALLDGVAGRLSTLEIIERVIEPALVEIGERWFRGECDIFQEHYAVSALFVRLGLLLDAARRANPTPIRTALVGTVKGDRHEGGVLMVSLALELAGWRAVPLGVDMPSREYQKAVELWRPDALALSFVLSRNINKRFAELSKIRLVPVFVGGRSIVNHQGLARRYGLIPLVGSLSTCITMLMSEAESFARATARSLTSAR